MDKYLYSRQTERETGMRMGGSHKVSVFELGESVV